MNGVVTGKPKTEAVSYEVLFAIGLGQIIPQMTEDEAAQVSAEAAFAAQMDEDEEGYIELLLQEAETREGYRSLYTFGPYSDF